MARDSTTAWIGAVLFCVASVGGLPIDSFAFHTEWILLLCTVPAFCLVLAGLQSGRWWLLLVAGMLFGCAFVTKQPALLDLAAAGIFVVAHGTFFPGSTDVAARSPRTGVLAAALAGGFFLVVGSVLLLFWLSGVWNDFWYWFWQYNTEVYVPAIPLATRLQRLLLPWRNPFCLFFPMLCLMVSCWALLRLAQLYRRGRHHLSRLAWHHQVELMLLLWFVLGVVAASMSGRYFSHYCFQALPPACALAAVLLTALARLTTVRMPQGRAKFVSWLLLLGAVVLASDRIIFLPSYDHRDPPMLFWEPPLRNQAIADAIRYVREQTEPDDAVFVWGFQAEIYTLSERRPASRYLFFTPLSGLIPWPSQGVTRDVIVPGSWQIFLAEVERHAPKVIIDTHGSSLCQDYPPERYPELRDLLLSRYELVRVFPAEGTPMVRLFRLRD